MRCYRNVVDYRYHRRETVTLHKGYYLLPVFEFVKGGDVHVVFG
jgi:hypothetical protein